MAFNNHFSEEEFSCPVCRDIFRDPVLLSCGHSFCKTCMQQCWETNEVKQCPVCRKRSTEEPPLNLALKSLCESFLKSRSQRASAQSEEICCLQTSISKAVSDFKNKLKAALDPLQNNLKVLEEAKQYYERIEAHIKNQAQHTERQIKEEFEKLHQFLRHEEAARISALKEEEERKSYKMMKKIEKINGETESISEKIRNIQKATEAEGIPLLHNMTIPMKQLEFSLKNPEKASGALINVVKHLSNLKFKVWEKMQEILRYTPVTLDPNTVHPHLHLSDDLTTVEYRDQRSLLPDNPERFDECRCVLGAEGFSSGTHCWDVEVGDSDYWAVGVIRKSESRKGKSFWNSVCVLVYSKYPGEYKTQCQGQTFRYFTVRKKLQRIRVLLDWDRGIVIFIDPLTSTHLHSLTHTFTEKVLPFFSVSTFSSLKILPVKTSVVVEQLSSHSH